MEMKEKFTKVEDKMQKKNFILWYSSLASAFKAKIQSAIQWIAAVTIKCNNSNNWTEGKKCDF